MALRFAYKGRSMICLSSSLLRRGLALNEITKVDNTCFLNKPHVAGLTFPN